MASSTTPQRTYQAFISYRHADNTLEGRQWATWLHQAIETYQVPDELVGKKNSRGEEIPERIFPIFRDEDELPADADLGNSIANALKASRLLVVVCSPNAVASTYVADEIDYFKRLGHSDRIIAMIIDGEPNVSWDTSKHKLGFSAEQECFPEPLQFRYDENGNRTEQRAEPIAADFRVFHDGHPQQAWTSQAAYRQQLKAEGKLSPQDIDSFVKRYGEQQNLMLLKIIAGILGVPLGELTQRDKAYQLALAKQRAKRLRQWLAAVGVLAMVAIGAGIWAYMQQQVAEQQRDTALVSQSQFLLNQAKTLAETNQYDDAILLGLNAMPGIYGGERPLVNDFAGVRLALRNNTKQLSLQLRHAVKYALFIPNSQLIAAAYASGEVDLIDGNSGEIKHTFAHNRELVSLKVSPSGRYLVAMQRGYKSTIWDIETKTNVREFHLAIDEFKSSLIFTPDEDAVFVAELWQNRVTKYALDNEEPLFHYNLTGTAEHLFASDDGKLLGIQVLDFDDKESTEHFVILDAQSGDVVKQTAPTAADYFPRWNMRPYFPHDTNELWVHFKSSGTFIYRTGDEPDSHVENVHIVMSKDVKQQLVLNTRQRISSGNELADQLNDLSNNPLLMQVGTEIIAKLSHPNGIETAEFSTDKRLYTSDQFDNWFVWDALTGNQIARIDVTRGDRQVIDVESKRLLSTSRDESFIDVYRLDAPSGLAHLPKGFSVRDMGVSPSGQWLIITNQSTQDIAWLNTRTNEIAAQQTIPCKMPYTYHYEFSADESLVYMKCNNDDEWFKWSRETNETHFFSAWMVDGKHNKAARLIDNDDKPQVQIFVPENDDVIVDIDAPPQISYPITDEIKFHENGKYISLASEDDSETWLVEVESTKVVLKANKSGRVFWLSQPQWLAVVTEDDKAMTTISFWSATGELQWEYTDWRKATAVESIANGKQLILATENDQLLWLDVTQRQLVRTMNVSGYINDIANYPEQNLVSINGANSLVFSSETGDLIDSSTALNANYLVLDSESLEFIEVGYRYYHRYPALLNLQIDDLIKQLPAGKRCLTAAQRAQYYLPPLTAAQRQQRGCL